MTLMDLWNWVGPFGPSLATVGLAYYYTPDNTETSKAQMTVDGDRIWY